MMAEEVGALTFPMSRESESASRLKTIISDMLPRFSDDYTDDVFSEYVTVLVCNGKSQSHAREDLDPFLGEKSRGFVACLWELLLEYFSLEKQENLASEPRTGVDFGFHDTLMEQDLSSRKYDDCDQKATNSMNLISATDPIEDVEAPVSPKVKKMKMLREELIDIPCRRARPKEKDRWNSSGYSRKILRSVIVAIKQPCGRNTAKYEKSMDERSRALQKRPYLPEREIGSQSIPSGGAVSARSLDASSHQETMPRASVWDRLGRASTKRVRDTDTPRLPTFGIRAQENKVVQQHVPPFPAAYSEQYSETYQREIPAVGYRHGVCRSDKAKKSMSVTITSSEPRTAYNLSRKRRYGIISANSGEFSSVLQNKEAEQDVEKPSLLSKSDLFSEIKNVKEKLQQLELRINQSKQSKKQKVEEVQRSPQSVVPGTFFCAGELQYQQDVTESRIIHLTNVHYAAKKEAISMFFSSKCGAVENVTIVTDPVTRHPKGTAFVTFATTESVNKAIALSGTMFYSRPIKVASFVIDSGVVSAPQIVTGS
ncbi:PREDICTED: uncharacterized protein LOC104713886 isoform X2 [Camelina sativa]|uniref:Uncharacterized protein LOC104713886 isoform X2 n=1 Tax=Camelina sativa TaxID=90675 RepID=A0ABM0TPP9_CAMSA|nr:PREDICTED: uncharacterized protein LOC104713886 isoform X2 [Camelina sativa]